MEKTIYNYDRITFELIGQSNAPLDPKASTKTKPAYLMPAFSTDIQPPAPVDGQAAVFDETEDVWSMVEDHRGSVVYDTASGAESIIDVLGPLPNGVTDIAPITFQTWDAVAGAWVDDITAIVNALRDEIDAEAEAARLRYITGGAGQSAVYLMKAQEADVYKAAGYPTPATGYPLLNGEASATGQSERQVADSIIATRDTWLPLAGAIEGHRVNGKALVAAAADRADAQAKRDAAVTALQAI